MCWHRFTTRLPRRFGGCERAFGASCVGRGTRAGSLATLGLLPPVLRSRLGIDWSTSEERSFQVLARIARTVRPLMPPQAKSFGQTYLRWRRRDGR